MRSWKHGKFLVTLVQQVKHPFLIASLALHGLLLFLPFLPPISVEPPATKPTTKSIRLTRLPLSSKHSPVPMLKSSPIAQPSFVPKPPQATASPSVPTLPVSPPPLPTASPIAISASPIASAPTPGPTVSPSPLSSPTPLITPSPFADFPHVSGAQAGCAGSDRCWQTADTQWRAIAANIQQDLEDKGYALESLPLADEAGRQVYRVSKAGEAPYYLSFISTPQGTIYSSTERPMTPEEMNILSGV